MLLDKIYKLAPSHTQSMVKIDPYKHKESWTRWKDKVRELGGIPDISRQNSETILKYLYDIEFGINTSLGSRKGARGFTRLNNLRQRLTFLSKKFEEYCGNDDLTKLIEHQVCSFFVDMRNGVIKQ